jgi:fructose-1-phosphate kinase PfkB-like protein
VIVCVAANPSIDKLFEVERLVPGSIHRPVAFVQTAGGKGLNVARAAHALRADVRATGILRGGAGRWIEHALREEGIAGSFVWTDGETRSSLSVASREGGDLTEFYEHGEVVSASAWDGLLEALSGLAQPGGWRPTMATRSSSVALVRPGCGWRSTRRESGSAGRLPRARTS